jgi:hypothetical protein
MTIDILDEMVRRLGIDPAGTKPKHKSDRDAAGEPDAVPQAGNLHNLEVSAEEGAAGTVFALDAVAGDHNRQESGSDLFRSAPGLGEEDPIAVRDGTEPEVGTGADEFGGRRNDPDRITGNGEPIQPTVSNDSDQSLTPPIFGVAAPAPIGLVNGQWQWRFAATEPTDANPQVLMTRARRHGALLVRDGNVLRVTADRALHPELLEGLARHAGTVLRQLSRESDERIARFLNSGAGPVVQVVISSPGSKPISIQNETQDLAGSLRTAINSPAPPPDLALAVAAGR